MRRDLSVLLLLPAIAAGGTLWAEPVNPFARPLANDVVRAGPKVEAISERPILRGLIAAGPSSIANLNGHLLAIGESFAGYELERVDEDSAVFLQGDKSIKIYLEKPSQENSE